jgi:hypothetical protein
MQHPLLKQLVQRQTAEAIDLTCGTTIEVQTASFRSTRGYSVAAILADEVAFWHDADGAANPASEIFTALRPSMATLPRSLLMVATTPYSRKGIVYATWKRHWAKARLDADRDLDTPRQARLALSQVQGTLRA